MMFRNAMDRRFTVLTAVALFDSMIETCEPEELWVKEPRIPVVVLFTTMERR